MTIGPGVERLDRARFGGVPEADRAAGARSLIPTHDPTCCIGRVVLEARE
jgi:hypothetical protein